MLSRADMMGKIQQLYKEGRSVPYLTFMQMFNDLLADQAGLVPEEPSDGLKEQFRAACMGAAVGLFDREGRGEQRLRDFREKIYPYWKARLSPAEFAPYEDIVEGSERRKREAREKERAREAADDRSRELLLKLGLAQDAEAETAPAPAAELPAHLRRARTFGSVDELCAAIRSGDLKADYLPREKAPDLARYPLDEHEVTVRLARAAGQTYVVLTVGVGRGVVPDALERADLFAAETGYMRMADFAYLRKDDEFTCTMSVGPHVTNMTCAADEGNPDAATVRRIQRLHRDLGELAERMRP
jgi:hypothetical protein